MVPQEIWVSNIRWCIITWGCSFANRHMSSGSSSTGSYRSFAWKW